MRNIGKFVRLTTCHVLPPASQPASQPASATRNPARERDVLVVCACVLGAPCATATSWRQPLEWDALHCQHTRNLDRYVCVRGTSCATTNDR